MVQSAITHLVKTMQAECFNSPGNTNIPDLVKDLNLFIEEEGFFRLKGRINKNVTHEEGVQNPILQKSPLDYQLIIHFHHQMYMLIFTCLNTRTVYLELIPDNYEYSFFCLNFTAIQQQVWCSISHSDNARSFLKGCDVISEVFSCSQFLEHFQPYNIKTCYHTCLLSLGRQYLGKVDSSSQKLYSKNCRSS